MPALAIKLCRDDGVRAFWEGHCEVGGVGDGCWEGSAWPPAASGLPSPQHGELSGLGSQEPQPGNGDGLAGDEARLGQSSSSTWKGSSGRQCPVTYRVICCRNAWCWVLDRKVNAAYVQTGRCPERSVTVYWKAQPMGRTSAVNRTSLGKGRAVTGSWRHRIPTCVWKG